MDKLLVLMLMIALHIFADYHLQGIFASMKQSDWWNKQIENYGSSIYKNDHKVSLATHSFEWAFVMMLPLFYEVYHWCWNFDYYSLLAGGTYIGLLVLNTIIHYKVDDAKANRKTISLAKDQSIYLIQVFFTWLIFVAVTWNLFMFY